MIFLHIRDSLFGYFDNLRSDSFFKDVRIENISTSRMNRWSHRNFNLVNLSAITKAQAKALSRERIERISNNDAQWRNVAKNLSKSQISRYENCGRDKFKYFSANKVYKLFIGGTFRSQDSFEKVFDDFKGVEEKRLAILSHGLTINLQPPAEINSLDYLYLLKNRPLSQALRTLRSITPSQMTPAIANEIISKLDYASIPYLSFLNFDAIDAMWKCGSLKLTSKQCDEFSTFIKAQINAQNFNFLTYMPIYEGLLTTEVAQLITQSLKAYNQNAIQVIGLLSTDRLLYIWNYLPQAITPHLTTSSFAKLAMNNAQDLSTYLGERYYSLLKACPQDVFKIVWEMCPHLRSSIVYKMDVDPKTILKDIKEDVLLVMIQKSPSFLNEYPELLQGKNLLAVIDGGVHEVAKLNLKQDQVEYYLNHSENPRGKAELIAAYLMKYPSLINTYPDTVLFLNRVSLCNVDVIATFEGLKEILSQKWDPKDAFHMELGLKFNFDPKQFPSEHWIENVGRMGEQQYDMWVKANPNLNLNDTVLAIFRLSSARSDEKKFILRARRLWEPKHNELVRKLANHPNIQMIAPYCIPLPLFTAELIKKYKSYFIAALNYSFAHKLDDVSVHLDRSVYLKEEIIQFLDGIGQPNKAIKKCLEEWNQWAFEQFKTEMVKGVNERSLLQTVERLKTRNLLSDGIYNEMQAVIKDKMALKLQLINATPEYKSLIEAMEQLLKDADGAISKFAANYYKLKEQFKDLLSLHEDLKTMCEKIREKKIEIDNEQDIFGFFGSLIIPSDKGLSKEVADINKERIQQAYNSNIAFVEDLNDLKVSVKVNGNDTLVPIIVRDEVGTVDFITSLNRLTLKFPLALFI